MKYQYIEDICASVNEFYTIVVAPGKEISDEDLVKKCSWTNVTEHDDGTMDIDWDLMCFTVKKNAKGNWELCGNATYYIPESEDEMTLTGETIEVELFEEEEYKTTE